MESVSRQDMQGMLRGSETYGNIMGEIDGMQGGRYRRVKREEMLK